MFLIAANKILSLGEPKLFKRFERKISPKISPSEQHLHTGCLNTECLFYFEYGKDTIGNQRLEHQ